MRFAFASPVEEIYRAAALLELAKWRVLVTVLADTFRQFTSDFEKEWLLAVQGTEAVYVTMTWSEGLTFWNIAVDDLAPSSELGDLGSSVAPDSRGGDEDR